MSYFDRKRSNVVIGADLLESRALLNAHLPHSPIAHVTSIHADTKAPKPISGTLTGMDPISPIPTNPRAYLVTWSATGSSTVGPAAVTATYQEMLIFTSNHKAINTSYTDGSGTLTLGNGSTLALTFTGSRHTMEYQINKPSPPVTYKFTGTAIVESGPNKGQVDKFTASYAGPYKPSPFLTVRFTLK
jgi:hypothetical protein